MLRSRQPRAVAYLGTSSMRPCGRDVGAGFLRRIGRRTLRTCSVSTALATKSWMAAEISGAGRMNNAGRTRRVPLVFGALQARIRLIHRQLERLEELKRTFPERAKDGDVASGSLVVRIQERRSTLLGLNAPIRVDPVELVRAEKPQLSSTQQLLEAVRRLRAEDPKRRMNGGPGYGDVEHDAEDAELTAWHDGSFCRG